MWEWWNGGVSFVSRQSHTSFENDACKREIQLCIGRLLQAYYDLLPPLPARLVELLRRLDLTQRADELANEIEPTQAGRTSTH